MKLLGVNVHLVDVVYAYGTDGGGMGIETSAIGFFTNAAKAQEVTKGNPFAAIKHLKALKISHPTPTRANPDCPPPLYYILAENEPVDMDGQAAIRKEEVRKRALSKLSDEEKAALGIK